MPARATHRIDVREIGVVIAFEARGHHDAAAIRRWIAEAVTDG